MKAFLSIHKDVFKTHTFEEVDLDLVDHLAVVDTNKWERLEGMAGLQTRNDLDIQLWDHHPIRGNISTPWMVSEVIGATITLLLRRIKQERYILTPIQATLFFHPRTRNVYRKASRRSRPSSSVKWIEASSDIDSASYRVCSQTYVNPSWWCS